MLKSFGCVISSVDLTSFACALSQPRTTFINSRSPSYCFLKTFKRILEICLQLILSNLEVRSSVIWVGRKTKDLVVYVKVNWQPLTNVWGQFSSKLTSTLFVCLTYARNRSLARDLFCGVSSAGLPSAIHILRNSLLQRTMTEISISSGQSRIKRNMCIKMGSRPGIIIYATSHYDNMQNFQTILKVNIKCLTWIFFS